MSLTEVLLVLLQIIDLSELQFVAELPLLRELNLTRNPVRELPDYRLAAIFQLQKLHELDCQQVDIKEKVCSTRHPKPGSQPQSPAL